MRLQPGWAAAVGQLRKVYDAAEIRGDGAPDYASRSAGARAAMVFDVVASQRRKYVQVVVPAVERLKTDWPGMTLAVLAAGGPTEGFGLPPKRWATISAVAAGFCRYRGDRPELAEMSDDELVAHWATAVEPIRLTPRLDPYVGAVSGIALFALFAYMRMRSGADALKPDVRVRSHLARLGFPAPASELLCSWSGRRRPRSSASLASSSTNSSGDR